MHSHSYGKRTISYEKSLKSNSLLSGAKLLKTAFSGYVLHETGQGMKRTKNMHGNFFSIDSRDLPAQVQTQRHCLQQGLPDEAGVGRSVILQIDNDFSLIDTRYTPSKNLSILSKIDYQEPRLVLTIGLKGQSCFASKVGSEFFFTEGYATITAFNSSIGERKYTANKSVMQLRLSVSKAWLEPYIEANKLARLFNKKEVQLISHQPISAQGIGAVRQLMAYYENQPMNTLSLHGQSMTLLGAELAQLFENDQRSSTAVNSKDEAIAELARDILVSEFKNPPSIALLSQRVGTNQLKLKKLFHHFFDCTPYGLVLEVKMQHAYQLLKSGQYQVAVVADLVGYNQASNFSAAFVRYFGFTPKAIAKQR